MLCTPMLLLNSPTCVETMLLLCSDYHHLRHSLPKLCVLNFLREFLMEINQIVNNDNYSVFQATWKNLWAFVVLHFTSALHTMFLGCKSEWLLLACEQAHFRVFLCLRVLTSEPARRLECTYQWPHQGTPRHLYKHPLPKSKTFLSKSH